MDAMQSWPLAAVVALFIGAALVILIAGWCLASFADRLADATGMGEALAGALLLGASTSLPGILTSAVTAHRGYAELAYSNALGGIAAQTCFLAIADITYRKTNLEHAAASLSNMMQAALLITLLSIPLVASASPELSIYGLHPASVLMLAIYIYGMRMISQSKHLPNWKPDLTPETYEDIPEEGAADTGLSRLWIGFGITAVIVGSAGWLVAESAIALTERTGLSESAVGGVFTALATSLPELATAIAAVRQGALTLAVADIIGGNSFDTLFIAVADGAYREGSIFHAIGNQQSFMVGVVILLHAILLLGLLRREKKGIANIGFESISILAVYGAAVACLFIG
jgi:cation:H+ antiporter